MNIIIVDIDNIKNKMVYVINVIIIPCPAQPKLKRGNFRKEALFSI